MNTKTYILTALPTALLLALLISLFVAHHAEAKTLEVDDTMPLEFSEGLADLGWYGVAGDNCECLYSPDPTTWTSPVSFQGMTDAEIVETVNSLSDAMLLTLAETGNLPEPPGGYTYAEDNTLVPNSHYTS